MASAPGSLKEAHVDFAVDLFKLLTTDEKDKDVFLSPISICVALSMTYSGAGGSTAKQINEVMFKGLDETTIHAANEELIRTINTKSDAYALDTANRLYSMSGYNVLKQFSNILAKNYHSEFRQVDFKTQVEQARQEINHWVSEVTRNKINDLLAKGVLNSDTRLVIVNAIYFKGDWDAKFDPVNTIKKPFYSSGNKEIEVDMMHKTDKFQYGENGECQVLGMHYKKRHLAMYVILPKERYGLKTFEKTLTGAKLLQLIQDTSQCEVEVQFPKFKLEQTFELSEVLPKMGMDEIFDPKKANFSRITDDPTGLVVSNVIHKAFVEVNEKGSEAAAATAVVMKKRCLVRPVQAEKHIFVADHAFFFAIWDHRLEAALFLGHASSLCA